MSNEDHGYISPSQLARLRRCPGYLNLRKQLVDVDDAGPRSISDDAQLGILKHDATRLVYEGKPATLPTPADYEEVEWCAEQIHNIVEACDEQPVVVWEEQLDLRELLIPTSKHGNRPDCVIISGSIIYLIELKYGAGWVPHPRFNDQTNAYAWGVWKNYGCSQVNIVKLQPKLEDEYRRLEYTRYADEMPEIGGSIRKLIEDADSADAPIVRGPQCTFCSAKSICPRWREAVLSIPRTMTVRKYMEGIAPAERTDLYENIVAMQKWAEAAKKDIDAYIFSGGDVAGYGIKNGKSQYEWTDELAARTVLEDLFAQKGLPIVDIVIPATIISPGKAKELLGKSKKITEALTPVIDAKPGKPVVGKVKEDE